MHLTDVVFGKVFLFYAKPSKEGDTIGRIPIYRRSDDRVCSVGGRLKYIIAREVSIMIKPLDPSEFALAASVIRASFATVAKDFGITEQSCPQYVGFVTTPEKLQTHHNWGWLMYGLYENERLVGYASISKETAGAYEIHNLAVLPDYRHKGYGRLLLDFSIKRQWNWAVIWSISV